jgi:Phage ABA sandwich domain
MTEQQIIETLATKVMGWHKELHPKDEKDQYGDFVWCDESGEVMALVYKWNPLKNISHAFQVLRKLGEYRLYKEDGMPVICVLWERNVLGKGETEEAAIVDAALKAVA